METDKTIDSLKTLAEKSKTACDVFHDFATRVRTRGQITTRSLHLRMKREGFNHTRDEYGNVLRELGRAGLGKVHVDQKGRVVKITDVNTRLQSIGQAVVSGRKNLNGFKQRTRYTSLPTERSAQPEVPAPEVSIEKASDLIRAILKEKSLSTEKKLTVLSALIS